jgi:16S rRNA (cytosine1402-N4)-methyltransferase
MVQSEGMKSSPEHIPVLLDQVVELLNPQNGERYFDGTAGLGGHAQAIADKVGESGQLILVDRDIQSVARLREHFGDRAEVIHSDYVSTAQSLQEQGRGVDMVLLDLGVSSPQLDQPERGFSFQSDGPLDMRMNQDEGPTAADVVNTTSESELADIIYRYGEERHSRRIAREIVRHRPFTRTTQLAELLVRLLGRGGEIHPATRTFQALRIYLNAELEQLEQALPTLLEILEPNGRLAVISFHSLEDRIVKEFFNRESRDCICPHQQPICTCDHRASLIKLTKKPILGTQDAINPRARSAKLRAAAKLKQK